MPDAYHHLRRATLSDVDALADLRIAFLDELNLIENLNALPDLKNKIRAYFARAIPAETFLAWVIEIDGRIVATSGLVFHEFPPSESNLAGREAYVMNMFTLREFRKRGLAAALLQQIINHIRQTPVKRIRLHATEHVQSLYKRCGFIPKESEMILNLS